MSNHEEANSTALRGEPAAQLAETRPETAWRGSFPSAAVTSDQRMKVLMADDNEVTRLLLNAQLTGWGLDVIVAKDGKQAWDLFLEHAPPLVLTDWVMPRLDGLELVRRIRAHPSDHYVYVVLLTSKSEKQDLVAAMDAGADDFLVKSCDNQELRVRLREGARILRLEQKLAEKNREIRDAQAALIQSEKLVSLGQLAAGMAHEINNPIAYVANNLAVLKRDISSVMEILDAYRAQIDQLRLADPQAADALVRLEQSHDLSWIQENTTPTFDASLNGLKRVRDIVHDLREFARLDEADSDTVAIGDMVRSTVAVLQHLISEKEIAVTVVDDTNPSIECRPAAVNQVLHNILINSIQACGMRDRVEIRVGENDDTVCLDIRDSGSGICDNDLPRIFEPFFTTREVGRGKGLGLSHCYGVIQDHGGTIVVKSKLGIGTTVRIELPKQRCTQSTEGHK
ncbi:MAG: response regulator [Rubripirellula sp.]|nr:response regulator [Rubripirellula sp.]